jgi:hypothetical protein
MSSRRGGRDPFDQQKETAIPETDKRRGERGKGRTSTRQRRSHLERGVGSAVMSERGRFTLLT